MRCYHLAVFAIGSLLFQTGCSGDDESGSPPAAGCPADKTLGGECVGVPTDPVCGEATCTTGVDCASTVSIANDAQLQQTLPGAAPGTCLVLAAGAYGDAEIPTGVRVLGHHASEVTLQRVQAKGLDTTVQGVAVGSGGVQVDPSAALRLSQVRVTGSATDGVRVESGGAVELVRTEVEAASRYGVFADNASQVKIDRSIVSASAGPGVWAQCSDGMTGCACPAPLDVTLDKTIVTDNKIVGVSLIGATATLATVDVTENTVASGFEPGGGIAVSQCSMLAATGVRVLDNSHFGILIDDSSATLGAQGADQGIEVSRNLLGIWAQNIGQSGGTPQVKVENGKLLANQGVGIGIDGESAGIIIYGTEIRDTSLIALPVLVGGVSAGSKEVGDGLNWLGTSQVVIDGLTCSGSARQSILLDGEVAAGSSISNVTLENGDDAKGILQQNLQSGGTQPTVQAAPPLTVTDQEQFAVPVAPSVPSGG